jgi:hypothetical protein
MEYGDLKYTPGSWRSFKDDPGWRDKYGSAIMRHLTTWLDPSEPDVDPETGVSHLAHAGAGVLIALWLAGEDYVKPRDPSSPARPGE